METVDPFQLGSISKVYTATVVLQLVEEGRLSLAEPLADFFPDFPNATAIQLRHLLQHTSGLADVAVWAYFRPEREEMISLVTKQWTRDELLAAAVALPPDFAPGEDWSYSNTNFILLAAIVEEVTGEPFAVELRRRMFAPLGLERTWLSQYEDAPLELATTGYLGPLPFWSHSEMFGELGPTTGLDGGNMEWGAGGVVSSAEDALGFLTALLGGDLISSDSLRGMESWVETPFLGAPRPETPPDLEDGYGFGLIRIVRPGYQMIGHGGVYNGHTAGLWRVPECEATVAFYLNRGFSDGRALMDRWFHEAGCQEG